MIDRRKLAPVLLGLAALLAAVSSLQPTYSMVYKGFGPLDLKIVTSLWTTNSEPPDGPPDQPALFAAGWPVVWSLVIIVVAVVLLVRDRTAFAGRPLAAGGAGFLAGVVFLYVTELRSMERIIRSQVPPQTDARESQELVYHSALYLLVVAAVIAVVGAALAQRRHPEPAETEEEDDENEDGVVVHQLGNDDDTPPFGLAIPHDEPQQETR
ncbi:hypothetical protein ACFWNN_14740 [Lentzea sp. NPDC058450]|uniref:hypothetical protein n=1 Tax=Lentzea sp. NPDC058450 TaxID=3346505 RepID=UPI0036478726